MSEEGKLGLDLGREHGDLLRGVKDLDGLSERIVVDVKGTLEGAGELAHLALGGVEALGHKVERLVLCDGVLGGGCLEGIKGHLDGHVCQAVLQLSKR